ncbi:MAG: tRNA (adenosine(37)-N6)-threonylcarbamoyltransferase complex ATPase subunit type 1 TsaE [Dehalococcoidia bacterium]|mgnify:CR=1 FL=1|nr:tRNA (adenosine(37)-N6)-threonylcarbamoyltransferase complex ATPase subunit type 1 TsaE [Dehalococcoidia bacterium]HCV00323.1 tRNA (adenosine(37)-N6)-threonylcarbamoyltransferase complex ATPase subunit type 1 TsaE [Dehalococcoidia bacterium]
MSTSIEVTFVTTSEEETRSLGARLGDVLHAGDVILLGGDLGSGKTRLAQGIGRGLGCTGPINSPTFVLVNEHQGRECLFHADLYRIAGATDLSELGLWDEAERGVLVVEWPDRAEGGLPAATLIIDIACGEGNERSFRLQSVADRGCEILAELELT